MVNSKFSIRLTGGTFKQTSVGVCLSIRTADMPTSNIGAAGWTALFFALSLVGNPQFSITLTRGIVKQTFVVVGLSIRTADRSTNKTALGIALAMRFLSARV